MKKDILRDKFKGAKTSRATCKKKLIEGNNPPFISNEPMSWKKMATSKWKY